MANLNTENQDQIIYENEYLHLAILGGIKLKGLDQLRVTIKAELDGEALRHNLDLYNDTQLMKLTRKIAERMQIGVSVVGAVLNELINELEHYRLEQLKSQKSESEEVVSKKQLTAAERKAAEDFLKSTNLLEATNELIGKSGVIGEENNRLLMYLIFTSRKREQPLHVISLGASGTGKTHLQEKIGELMPEEDKIEITTLSENAFYYFERRALSNKLLLIEDLDGLSGSADGSKGAMYALREIQSKKRITKTVAKKDKNGKNSTTTLTVEGPVSVAGCTTKESIYEDNANRSFLLYLDESETQDERIMNYQRSASSGKIDQATEKKAAELLRNCQRVLQPIKVINPYAEQLKIPKAVFKARRTNTHYLQFIEAITFYHQRQRPQRVNKDTGEIYIETTLEDIENANRLLKPILLRKSDDLTGACRNYFEKLKLYLIGQEEKVFESKTISQALRIPITTVKRHHLNLKNSGYLKLIENKKSKAHRYEVVSYEEYQSLKKEIETVLDQQLQAIREEEITIRTDTVEPNSSEQPSSKNGLTKSLPVKRKNTSAQ